MRSGGNLAQHCLALLVFFLVVVVILFFFAFVVVFVFVLVVVFVITVVVVAAAGTIVEHEDVALLEIGANGTQRARLLNLPALTWLLLDASCSSSCSSREDASTELADALVVEQRHGLDEHGQEGVEVALHTRWQWHLLLHCHRRRGGRRRRRRRLSVRRASVRDVAMQSGQFEDARLLLWWPPQRTRRFCWRRLLLGGDGGGRGGRTCTCTTAVAAAIGASGAAGARQDAVAHARLEEARELALAEMRHAWYVAAVRFEIGEYALVVALGLALLLDVLDGLEHAREQLACRVERGRCSLAALCDRCCCCC